MDVAIKIFDLSQEVKKGKINIQGDMKDVAQILQGVFSVPFLLISGILYFRFLHAFSR